MSRYHTTLIRHNGCGMISLEIKIEKVAARKMLFRYLVRNSGTLNLCHDIHICSEKFGKICLERDVFAPGNFITVERTLELELGFNERNVVDSATAFARVDGDDWIKSEKICASEKYLGNLVNCTMVPGAGYYEMYILAHPLNDDVIREPFFFLTAGPAGEITAETSSYWDPGTAAIGLPVQSPSDVFSFTVPLVDLEPGQIVFFHLLCGIRRKSTNLQPPDERGHFFYRQGVQSPVTTISGSWLVGSETSVFLL